MLRNSSTVGCLLAALVLTTPAIAQQRSGQRGTTPAEEASRRAAGPQAFSVALVLGDMQAGSAQDNVPTAARKALSDMKDFLPFKSYRLLDVQWTLCCGRSAIVSRLRGVEDQEYDLELNPSGPDNRGKLYVRFALRDPGAHTTAMTEMAALTQQKLAADAQLADLRARLNDNHPDVVKARAQVANLSQRLDELRRHEELGRRGFVAGARGHTIIDTSFTMDVGETVVVGTSRVKGGDKALIALLTAVPQRSTATR